MTKYGQRELERKISDWQGRVVHAYTQYLQACKDKRSHDADEWHAKWLGAKACVDALYDELYVR